MNGKKGCIFKKKTICVFIVCMCLMGLYSQAALCKLGVYVTALYDLDFSENTFNSDMWIWGIYSADNVVFDNTIEIANASDSESSLYATTEIGNRYWMQQKFKTTVRYNWDTHHFPFDKNTLRIDIEDVRDTTEIVFIPDIENSRIDNSIALEEWEIRDFYVEVKPREYWTTYGNPILPDGASEYSRFSIYVTIARKIPWVTFFKLLSCVYISFIISLLPFFMKPETDSRLALPCASLFAVVSNKYIVESIVPSSVSMTLLDTIHSLTLVAIVLICTVLIRTDGMRVSGDENRLKTSIRIDFIAAVIISIIYTFINIALIFPAIVKF